MADFPYSCALIIGAGPGISASLARRLSKIGLRVGLAARDAEKLKPLAQETAAGVFAVDAPSRSRWRSYSSIWKPRSPNPMS
jgi:NADP-dependent 3-hydroxy acid dehydrogenase YdfG